jgi:hypothetical protein
MNFIYHDAEMNFIIICPKMEQSYQNHKKNSCLGGVNAITNKYLHLLNFFFESNG